MAETLRPCPFCGGTSLKHYTRQARQGGYRGVIECKECGARLEAYSDDLWTLSKAYMGDWNEAKIYAQGYAYDEVARKWNARASDGRIKCRDCRAYKPGGDGETMWCESFDMSAEPDGFCAWAIPKIEP